MLAKVIAWAPTREQAARRLAAALARARLHGVVTNRDLLVAVLRDDARSWPARSAPPSSTDRRSFDRPPPGAGRRASPRPSRWPSATGDARTVQRGIPVAWRNVVSQPSVTESRSGRHRGDVVEWCGGRDGYVVDGLAVVVSASPTDGDARARTASARRTTWRSPATPVDVDAPRGPRPADAWCRGSPTRPTRSPAAACSRRCPAPSSASRSRQGDAGRGRPAGAGARGDEDAAHRDRAARRHGHRDRRRSPAPRCRRRGAGRRPVEWRRQQ